MTGWRITWWSTSWEPVMQNRWKSRVISIYDNLFPFFSLFKRVINIFKGTGKIPIRCLVTWYFSRFAEAIHAYPASERRGEHRRDRGGKFQRHCPARTHVAHSQSWREKRSSSLSRSGPVRGSLLQRDLHEVLQAEERHIRPLHLRRERRQGVHTGLERRRLWDR